MHTPFALDGSYNARSIGAPEQPWLVRSAALDGLTPGGERSLRARGVVQIIDLREPSEHQPSAHGLPVRSVPLYGEAPPASGSIEQIYADLVRDRGPQLVAAVLAIADASGASVVHCTAGKDRTGLVVALARLIAGDAREAVLADYELSAIEVRPARQDQVACQLDGLGLTAAGRASAERLHLDSPREALSSALDLVDDLGGPTAYLLSHGATPERLRSLAARASGSGSRVLAAVSA